jgi:hypothetical protein
MDFNDLQIGINSGRYTNHRVLPLRKYEKSKYSDYNRDERLFKDEQERVIYLFVEDCRKALEGYIGRMLSREQWKIAWDYVFTNCQGLTHFGIVSKLAELAPILDQFLMFHKTKKRKIENTLSL